jgi:ABC-2 type transport system permease protein
MTEPYRKKQTLKYGVNASLKIVIVAGILIALNVIGAKAFRRIDLTEGKEFTISKSTKQILGNLDDVVMVKVFFSKKLPPQLATLEQNLSDILKEYEVYSKGKVHVRFVDPGDDPKLRQEAQSMGIPQLQMNLMEKDQYQVTNVFLGIGIQYGDKTESIPVIQDLDTFEYDLTSAIVKLTTNTNRSLGFLTGDSERDINKDYRGIDQVLSEQYDIRTVDLNQGNSPVPDDLAALIVAGPRNIGDREKYEIDQFVMRGGKLVLLLDPIQLNETAGLMATPLRSGLSDLVEFYGVQVKDALTMEGPQSSALASFSQGFMSYVVPYPFWPKISQRTLNRKHPVTSRLESLTLPWTAPLELKVPEAGEAGAQADAGTAEDQGQDKKDEDKAATAPSSSNQPDVRGIVLARSSEAAHTQTGRYDLNPQSARVRMAQSGGQSYPLAVVLTGTFRSFYDGREIPAKPTATADAQGGTVTPAGDETALKVSPKTEILVVGSSNFVSDQFLRMFPENRLFLENALDWMTLGDELISIRSRGATARPLANLSDGAKALVKYLNTFGVAALVIIFGLVWRFVRKRSRQRLADIYVA